MRNPGRGAVEKMQQERGAELVAGALPCACTEPTAAEPPSRTAHMPRASRGTDAVAALPITETFTLPPTLQAPFA